MAGDVIPPEALAAMAGQAQEQQARTVVGPPPAGAPVEPEAVNRALWNALLSNAMKAAGANDSRAAKESAAAALDIAQAIVVLDPNLIAPQGVPPEVLAAAYAQKRDEDDEKRQKKEKDRG